MALRAFAFRCSPDSPVGDSLHDAQLSYARGVDGVQAAIDASPPIHQRVDILTRGSPITLDVVFTVKWTGGPPTPPTVSVADALLTSATHARRFPVTLRVETSKAGVVLEAATTVAHLELPLVVAGDAPPPETGHFVVHGREYVIRYQERFAFGAWVMTAKKGAAAVSMRIAPPFPGAECRMVRITATTMMVRLRQREGRTLPLAAVLVLMGEASAAAYAARVDEPRYSAAALAAAWPATAAEAEAAVREAVRGRLPPAPGLGIPTLSAAALLAEWVLPHLDAAQKLDVLAHGSAKLVRHYHMSIDP